jgi:hypothetical protein
MLCLETNFIRTLFEENAKLLTSRLGSAKSQITLNLPNTVTIPHTETDAVDGRWLCRRQIAHAQSKECCFLSNPNIDANTLPVSNRQLERPSTLAPI